MRKNSLSFYNSNINIVMYHFVRKKEKKYPNLRILEYDKFKSQIDYLCKNFNILSKNQFLEIMDSNKIPYKPSVLLTFDDGYKDHYDYVFPYLLKKKITGSFYAPISPITEKTVLDVNKIHYILSVGLDPKKIIIDINNFLTKKSLKKLDIDMVQKKIIKDGTISPHDDRNTNLIKRVLQYILPKKIRVDVINYLLEKNVKLSEKELSEKLYLNQEEIKEMHTSGMDFGSHSVSHPYLNLCNEKKQIKEILHSKLFFKKLGLSTKNFSIAYPYGSYNTNTLKIVKRLKLSYAFIDSPGIINSKNIKNKYIFPRLDGGNIIAND